MYLEPNTEVHRSTHSRISYCTKQKIGSLQIFKNCICDHVNKETFKRYDSLLLINQMFKIKKNTSGKFNTAAHLNIEEQL